jgi:spore coat protein U-like protein
MNRLSCLSLLTACLFGLSSNLYACQLSVQHISFGSYDPFSDVNLESVGYINISHCPANVTGYTISATTGQNSGYYQRTMTANGYTLAYNLYTSANHTMIFGDGSAGTATLFGTNANASYPVYGVVPAHQNIRIGQYNDSLIITLSF